MLGLKRYFTGIPCKHGHITDRNVCDFSCAECSRKKSKDRRLRNIESERKKGRDRRALDVEKAKRQCREWRSMNVEKVREYDRRYRKEKPEIIGLKDRRQQARRKGAIGSYEGCDIERIFSLQKGKCAYCRVSIKNGYDIDHIRPISRGGSNYPKNLQLLCKMCNQRKHAKDPIDWAQEIGRLL